MASEIILHHYPQSPVSEKVRLTFGMKGIPWRSVTIPRLPPKPDLVALTGGYRMTPVMQIGCDIFCDSQCIVRELERRVPEPTLLPRHSNGLAWGVGSWTDGPLFKAAIALVFGDGADDMPADFADDRGSLYFGPGFDLQALKESVPETLVQVRAQIAWMDERLSDGRDFMLGPDAGLPDALCYYIVWFIRGRYSRGPELLGGFSHLLAWEDRVRAIGHGRPTDMSADGALEIARAGESDCAEGADDDDPSGIGAGEAVTVTPVDAGGGPPVAGTIVRLALHEVAIRRTDARAGEVVVHFPRVGYRVVRA